MEEVLTRFHVLAQNIFLQLDNETLAKCKKVGRVWQTFLDNQKFVFIRKIKSCSSDPNEFLETILKYSCLKEVEKLASTAFKIKKEANRGWCTIIRNSPKIG